MKYTLLYELVEKPISGEWGSGEGNVNVIRTANFTNSGRIDYSKIVKRAIPENKVLTKKLEIEDIIIEKSGGSPAQPVGRVVFFDKKETYLCNNFTSILRPLKRCVFPKYLLYILFSNHKYGFVYKYQNKTTGIINLQLTKYLQGTKIPLPPLAEQKKIAAILDAADVLRQKDAQLVDTYNALSQSLFLDMFGDPVTNPMGWEKRNFFNIFDTTTGKLDSNASSSSGRYPFFTCAKEALMIDSYSYDQEALLLAGNNAAGIFDVKYYNGKFDAYQRTYILCLKRSDTVYPFMQIALEKKLEDLQRLSIGSSTRYLTMKILERLEFIIPPITLQNQFAERIQAIEAQKQQAQASLQKSEALFNSLLQRAFKGELTAHNKDEDFKQ